ncbi:Cystathionine gamma-synthase [Aquisphaera giovannonii]|uniref:Cystathionine gamma-synthase n=1 Tax=Aquisphaera giovannonii TaxID=406548 RepID=A0A5B9VV09_9BACT|nr:aminotransferase class V-fold PLP-dependent enzyme [Aquisphaera giovannonii]QEH31727.1 Cystathionine gamma-synthase [Aquisphaera giovannonii]
MKPATAAAQALGWIDEATRAVVPPLHPSSTFVRDADNGFRSGRSYTRADNPTYDQAEAVLATLENGAGAALFASGMAAATAVFLALRPGDHVVISRVMYWALRSWLLGFATDWGLRVEVVDTTDLDALEAAVRPGETTLVWIETPGNPTLAITDIAATAGIAHAAGARLAVDSTVATPVFTRPLDLGADVVMHSATKSLNGHSDVLAGALVTRAADAHWEAIKRVRVQSGGVLGTFEAWLLLRGMRTLYPRVRAAAANAMAVAQHFQGHPLVEDVLYPGLADFPGHAVAARQMQGGFGSLMSIRVKGGEQGAIAAAANVKIWKRATSLGGVESLVEHRASVEGAQSPAPPDLLRMSVGIEDAGDLIDDFEQALAASRR